MDDPPSSSRSSFNPGRLTTTSVAVRKRQAPTYNGDFGEYFSQQYTVLKLVLSYLNYFDLNTLRDVNSSLKSAADILLKKRLWLQVAYLDYLQGTDHCPEPLYNGHFIDLKIEPKLLFTFEAMSEGPSSRSKPKISLLMRDRNDKRFFPKSEIVPNSVKTFVAIGARGIIYSEMNDRNEMVMVQTMLERKVVLLYLPTSDNYDVSVMTHIVSTGAFDKEPIEAFLLSDSRPVQGIIFLKIGSHHVDYVINFMVKFVSSNQSQPLAVSGGFISSMEYITPSKRFIPGIIKAIVFRGEGIHCMSDFIGASTKNEVLQELKQPAAFVDKTFGKLNVNKTFILMFQCFKRNALPFEDHILLSNTFPGVPIFGVQTWGEIGFRSFRNPEVRFPKKKMISVIHSIKSTYMLISID